jgi:hypothetical protein
MFWNVVPLSPSRASLPAIAVWGLGGWYALELILFIVGATALVRGRDDRWLLIGAVILNFTLVHLFYWSNMRMRAPVVPLLALVVAVGLGVSLGIRSGVWRDDDSSAKHVRNLQRRRGL